MRWRRINEARVRAVRARQAGGRLDLAPKHLQDGTRLDPQRDDIEARLQWTLGE
ncbi:hypothetical protein [Sorangium sp. So ce1078]|uniref:hypothetical protein n=1 Tax=Sorangium sp. So ce1078 TaxID=3133329 RepID=UPI003F632C9E